VIEVEGEMRIRERNKKKNSLLNFIGVPFMLLTNPLPSETVSQSLFCHPELVSGPLKLLILLDAEPSSA
jgi:hypothetical protein